MDGVVRALDPRARACCSGSARCAQPHAVLPHALYSLALHAPSSSLYVAGTAPTVARLDARRPGVLLASTQADASYVTGVSVCGDEVLALGAHSLVAMDLELHTVRSYLPRHRNEATIKQVTATPELIMCGSDDGCAYGYHRRTGELALVLDGDASICNCIAVDAAGARIATSGLAATIALHQPVRAQWDPAAVADLWRGKQRPQCIAQ